MNKNRIAATVLGIGLVRVGAGIALGGAPRSFLRWEPDAPRGSSMVLLMRTVGIRDLALGLGTALAARSGSTREFRRWVGAGLVSDVLDVGAGLASTRTMGIRGVISAMTAAPVVAVDVWALAALKNE